MKRLTWTGGGRLLEDGEYYQTGESFETTDDRAAELLANPHVSVEIAHGDYAHLTRDELNELARKAGVSDPESLRTKQDVIDALVEPTHEAEADSGEGHSSHQSQED